MKKNYEREFDLNEIYRKLTSSSKPQTVKASEFFAPLPTLDEFQQCIQIAMLNRRQKVENSK